MNLHSLRRTCHPRGEGEDDDVVEGPAVVGMRREERQLTGRFLPQIHQEGGVNHGNGEAALPLLPADGHVGRRPLVITLQTQPAFH